MSLTIDQQRQRVEQEMTRMVDDLDRSTLRKMQGEMHLCAAKCCDDKNGSIDAVQGCIERCSAPVNRAQQYVQKELGEYQGRLQRCVMQCNDDIKLEMPPNPTEDEISKYTNKFERCAVSCVDKNIELLPKLFKTIKTVLAKGPPNLPN
ncbi:protein FAM136A [Sitodiplosis mosellana]|uniref:protein FAM136A n=1 Tax=Sitodiplosis mosellana TaxID=263140 RepID=UPI00244421B7|nr:protein FAM136A [Sitodiplosis mosellana]